MAPRETTAMTDIEFQRAITEARGNKKLVTLIHAYYRDKDRANRTPRDVLYLHMGLLMGVITSLIHPFAVTQN